MPDGPGQISTITLLRFNCFILLCGSELQDTQLEGLQGAHCLATQTGHWAAQHSAQPMPSSSFHQWAHLVFISDHKFTSIITYTVLTNNVPVCVVHLFGHMENTTAIWRYGGELLFLCLRLCQSDDMVCHVHVGSLYLLELSHLGPFFRALYTFLERPQTSVAASSIQHRNAVVDTVATAVAAVTAFTLKADWNWLAGSLASRCGDTRWELVFSQHRGCERWSHTLTCGAVVHHHVALSYTTTCGAVIHHHVMLTYTTMWRCSTPPYGAIVHHHVVLSYTTMWHYHTPPCDTIVHHHVALLYTTMWHYHTHHHVALSYTTMWHYHTPPYDTIAHHHVALLYTTMWCCSTPPCGTITHHHVTQSYTTMWHYCTPPCGTITHTTMWHYRTPPCGTITHHRVALSYTTMWHYHTHHHVALSHTTMWHYRTPPCGTITHTTMWHYHTQPCGTITHHHVALSYTTMWHYHTPPCGTIVHHHVVL